MAVVAFTFLTTPADSSKLKMGYWGPLNSGDTGAPVNVAQWADKSLDFDTQGTGSFGTGVTIEATGNPSDITNLSQRFKTVNNPAGTALSGVAAEKLETVLQHVYYLRPNCGTVSGIYVFLTLTGPR